MTVDYSIILYLVIMIRGEAIMLVKLSSAIPIILRLHTDFTYYSQNYTLFNPHGISDS